MNRRRISAEQKEIFILEIKNTGMEMKNVFNEFISALDTAKERVNDLEVRSVEITNMKLYVNEYGHSTKWLLNSLAKQKHEEKREQQQQKE